MYTLGTAAKAVGKSKSTISKALKSGRISGFKGEDGAFQIDPSELHRVYPVANESEQETLSTTPQGNNDIDIQLRKLENRLEVTQQRLIDKDDIISDLREDRDRWRQQATALLENKAPRGIIKIILGIK